MNAHHFFFAIHIPTGQVECFATKYIPISEHKPSRFKFWRINSGLERIGIAKTIPWNDEGAWHGQDEQLKFALGEKWKVLPFYEVCKILSLSNQPAK